MILFRIKIEFVDLNMHGINGHITKAPDRMKSYYDLDFIMPYIGHPKQIPGI